MYFTDETAKKIPCPLDRKTKCSGSECPIHRITGKATPVLPGAKAAMEAEKAKGRMYCGLGGKPEV